MAAIQRQRESHQGAKFHTLFTLMSKTKLFNFNNTKNQSESKTCDRLRSPYTFFLFDMDFTVGVLRTSTYVETGEPDVQFLPELKPGPHE